jgi:hypothetical protein
VKLRPDSTAAVFASRKRCSSNLIVVLMHQSIRYAHQYVTLCPRTPLLN